MLLASVVFILESAALVLLFTVTTADPGFIPRGPRAAHLPANSLSSDNSERYSTYMCAWRASHQPCRHSTHYFGQQSQCCIVRHFMQDLALACWKWKTVSLQVDGSNGDRMHAMHPSGLKVLPQSQTF